MYNSVLPEWLMKLPRMQQSVLMSAIRAPDGMAKHHKAKDLIRYYRRCTQVSAFEGKEILNPFDGGGGSFTGPIKVSTINEALDNFIDSRDEMTLHYYAHAMHAFEILGYKHPDAYIRDFWYIAYKRMVEALHVWPETENQMDSRLGDTLESWQARNDPSSVCSD